MKKTYDFTIDELAKIPFLSDMSDFQLDVLSKHLKKVKFREKDYVFREGDPYGSVYILVEGSALVLKEGTEEKKQKVLSQIKPPQIFGEQAILSRGTRAASIFALEQLVVAELTYYDFEKLSNTYPSIIISMLKKIASTISTRLKIINAKYVEASQRLDSL